MNGYVKIFLSTYKCIPSIMDLTHIGTENIIKSVKRNHKISEAKILIEFIHG